MSRRSSFLLFVPAIAALATFALLRRAGSEEAEPSSFLRFIDEGQGEGRLETAVIRYDKGGKDGEGGVEVTLLAAVHVGDAAYYDRLEELFADHDALLYEMVKDEDVEVRPGEGGGGLLGMFQRGLKDVLDLEFQLDGVDYSKENFVHADMDPATFARTMREKGESFLTLMLKAMLAEWKRQAEGKGSKVNGFTLLAALASEDSGRALKYLIGREFGEVEAMIAGLGEGTTILEGRNRKAMEVLRRELGKGRKKLGVFYGAAHMQDLEERLRDMGFQKRDEKWLTAWDIRRRESRAKDAAPAEPEVGPAEPEDGGGRGEAGDAEGASGDGEARGSDEPPPR